MISNLFNDLQVGGNSADSGTESLFFHAFEGLCKWIVPSIDMVIFVQRHASAPVLGNGAVLCVDADGCVSWESVRTLECEASHSSKYFIRSIGGVVALRFNPSRFCQKHNVDGVPDMATVLRMANEIVCFHGLPEFSEGPCLLEDVASVRFASVFSERGKVRRERFGVRLSMVHICWCFFIADDKAREFVAQSSVFKVGTKFGVLDSGGSSCWWGRKASRYWSAKLYVKFLELMAHDKRDTLSDLVDWSRGVGLVRHEVELYSRWLAENDLDSPSSWSVAVMSEVLKRFNPWQSGEVVRPAASDVSERLIALGVKPLVARRAQEALASYMDGIDVFNSRSQSARYRLRSVLLKIGVDIAVKPAINVVRLKHKPIVFDIRPAYLPERFWREKVPPLVKLVSGELAPGFTRSYKRK